MYVHITHKRPKQAHPLFPLLTPETLAPFFESGGMDGACGGAEVAADGGCCSQYLRVQRGGHALLLLYLALGQWAGRGGDEGRMEGEGEGARLLRQEVAQLRVKLQALATEMVGRLPAEGMK